MHWILWVQGSITVNHPIKSKAFSTSHDSFSHIFTSTFYSLKRTLTPARWNTRVLSGLVVISRVPSPRWRLFRAPSCTADRLPARPPQSPWSGHAWLKGPSGSLVPETRKANGHFRKELQEIEVIHEGGRAHTYTADLGRISWLWRSWFDWQLNQLAVPKNRTLLSEM